MKHLFLSLAAIAVLTFTACNSNSETEQTAETAPQITESTTGNEAFSELFDHYMHLTSALSSDEAGDAVTAANGILESLPRVEKDNIPADKKGDYDNIAADIEHHAKSVADNGGDIAEQRKHLEPLSKDFYEIAKQFGASKPMYKIYCSMYDNDRGAYWLSDNKEVKNPYFGADMYKCGEVQEELN